MVNVLLVVCPLGYRAPSYNSLSHRPYNICSVGDDCSNRFALVHQIEPGIDPIERQHVRDQIVDVDLAVHVPVDDLWYIGAAPCTAESGSLPDPASNQLERPGVNLLPRACDADDHRHAPTPMAGFERLAHQFDIANAFKGVVGSTVRQVHEVRD